MALDPRIALAGQPLNVQQAILGGQQIGEGFRQQGVRDQILNQQAQTQQISIARAQGSFMNQFAKGLKSTPIEQRAAVVAQNLPVMEQLGITPDQVLGQDISDIGLDRVITGTDPFVQKQQQQGAKFQFGASEIIKDDQGNLLQVVQRRDPTSGEVETLTSPIEGELVSSLGQTAEEKSIAEIEKELKKANIDTAQFKSEQELRAAHAREIARETATGKAEVELTFAQDIAKIELAKKKGEALQARQITRLDDAIEAGIAGAGALPDINRGLELLKDVRTGGLTAKSKTITDFFGTTSGEVGELNNILAQNVLAGLSAFTGAISEGERAFLEQMETNLSQGTAFNISQLNRMRNLYQRKVKEAIKAAEITEDEFALDLLNSAVSRQPGNIGAVSQEQIDANNTFVDNL